MIPARIRPMAAALVAVALSTLGAAGAAAQTGAPPPDTARWTAADVHFMSSMIGHHAQAIVMARMAPSHGASATVQTLAARIINAQQDEIGTMQRWLRDRGQPVPEAHTMDMSQMGGMQMGGMQHDPLMPGMLTPEQMQRLDAARGAEFDRLFLTFMIQHHRGAIGMVQDLFSHNGAGQDDTVFKFASDVNVDQTTEIARMQRMLAASIFGAEAQTQ